MKQGEYLPSEDLPAETHTQLTRELCDCGWGEMPKLCTTARAYWVWLVTCLWLLHKWPLLSLMSTWSECWLNSWERRLLFLWDSHVQIWWSAEVVVTLYSYRLSTHYLHTSNWRNQKHLLVELLVFTQWTKWKKWQGNLIWDIGPNIFMWKRRAWTQVMVAEEGL